MLRLKIVFNSGEERIFDEPTQQEIDARIKSEITDHPEIYVPGTFTTEVKDVTAEKAAKDAAHQSALVERSARLAAMTNVDSVNSVVELRAIVKAIAKEIGLI